MVSRVCAVRTCPNSSGCQNPEGVSSTTDTVVSYHSFPWRRRRIACKWLQVLHIPQIIGENKRLKHQLRVCSQHFSEDCYYVYPPPTKGQNMRLLKILMPEAVPDRNLPQEGSVDNFDSPCDKLRWAPPPSILQGGGLSICALLPSCVHPDVNIRGAGMHCCRGMTQCTRCRCSGTFPLQQCCSFTIDLLW
jgi:hypothetical protein